MRLAALNLDRLDQVSLSIHAIVPGMERKMRKLNVCKQVQVFHCELRL